MMEVFTTKELTGFELEVAQYLAALPFSGYSLINFTYTNPNNLDPYEIDCVIVYEPGIICCFEVKGYKGTWTGDLNSRWKSNGQLIKSSHGLNPHQQVLKYTFEVLKKRLGSQTLYINLYIIVPDEATVKIKEIRVDEISNKVSIFHLSKLKESFDKLKAKQLKKFNLAGILRELLNKTLE